jgi:hypothetical protein
MHGMHDKFDANCAACRISTVLDKIKGKTQEDGTDKNAFDKRKASFSEIRGSLSEKVSQIENSHKSGRLLRAGGLGQEIAAQLKTKIGQRATDIATESQKKVFGKLNKKC